MGGWVLDVLGFINRLIRGFSSSGVSLVIGGSTCKADAVDVPCSGIYNLTFPFSMSTLSITSIFSCL
jgi:hypothetical protein